jgi:hypothetical protein
MEPLLMDNGPDGYRLAYGSDALSVEIDTYRLPHGGPKRTLVVFRKISNDNGM